MYTLVDHKHRLVIFWSFGVAHAQLIRLANELVAGKVLDNVYSLVDPMNPNNHALYGDWAKTKDYHFIAVVTDPWSRLVNVYKEFMIRLKAHTLLDSKFRFVNGLQFSFHDVVKLTALMNPSFRAPLVKPQQPVGGFPPKTHIVPVEHIHAHLTSYLKSQGLNLADLKTLDDLSPQVLKKSTKATILSRAYIGHMPSSSFALPAMPPLRTFYNKELWEIVKETYEMDLDLSPASAMKEPLILM
jgi:hypothetical protein